MGQNPIVSLMQRGYTEQAHVKLRKEAKKIEFQMPEPQTLEKPDFIPTNDYVHSLAGTLQMGAVGFDTYGMGSGHRTARSLNEGRVRDIYNYDGDERINTAVMVCEEMDFTDSLAILANSLYEAFMNHIGRDFSDEDWESTIPLVEKIIESFFKTKRYDREYKHINLEAIKGLYIDLSKTTSFWDDCERLVEFISTERAYTRYTANECDYNDLVQDVHYTLDNDGSLCGLYFHTGCDVRCGFSKPVFGILTEGYIDTNASSLYFDLGDVFGKDYEWKNFPTFLEENDVDVPREYTGSCVSYWLRENGWITITLDETERIGEKDDKYGNYYADREIKLTQKAIDFIKRHNPRQKKLDEFVQG